MLYLLVALILFALAVCAAVSVSPVPTAVALMGTTAGSSALLVRADCAVAARCAGDTARSGRENRDGCAGGGSVTAAGVVATLPDVRAVGGVGPPGVDSLTVARKP